MIGYFGNIDDFWSGSLSTYQYNREVQYEGIRVDWHQNFKGILLQSFDDELPEFWPKFKEAVNATKGSVGWINLRPNQVLPPHSDSFYTLRKLHNVSIEQCIRYLIFLDDWQFGQHVEFETTPIKNWKKGDIWFFDHTARHWAVNASSVYSLTVLTLQV